MRSVPLHLVARLKAGDGVAAKLEPSSPGMVAWVIVGPFKRGEGRVPLEALEHQPWIYGVRSYELEAKLLENENDVHESQFSKNERYEVHSFAELDDLLERLVGDPSRFVLYADVPDYLPFSC